jgi:hypothetical protein
MGDALFCGSRADAGQRSPAGLEPGHFAFGLDVVQIPHLSSEQRRIGFNGTKEENLNKAPVLGPPAPALRDHGTLVVTGSYVPPIEVFDRLRTHVGRCPSTSSRWMKVAGAGPSGALASGRAPAATSPARREIAGNPDPMVNPFLCEEPSNYTFTSWTAGVELMAENRLSPRWSAFANAAYTYADLTFDVDAHYSGIHDQRRLTASGPIWSLGVGARYAVTERLSAALSLVHVPLDLRRPPDYGSESDSLTHIRSRSTAH